MAISKWRICINVMKPVIVIELAKTEMKRRKAGEENGGGYKLCMKAMKERNIL